MKSPFFPVVPRILIVPCFLVVLCVTVLTSCGGGGTSGSGSPTIRLLSGYIHSAPGIPLPGVTVTIEETGDSSLTDDAGLFRITTSLAPGDIHLFLESGDFEGSTVVNDIPEGVTEVVVDLSVNLDTALVQVVSVRVIVGERPTPTSTPSTESTPTPSAVTPTPAAAPAPSPSASAGAEK